MAGNKGENPINWFDKVTDYNVGTSTPYVYGHLVVIIRKFNIILHYNGI